MKLEWVLSISIEIKEFTGAEQYNAKVMMK